MAEGEDIQPLVCDNGTGMVKDDEYLASLQADIEKELKAKQEDEAALVEERRKEEELLKIQEEEQEAERQLAAKEGSLPQEPTPDDCKDA